MTTVGSVTPEWDPPYQATTIRGVKYKPVFDTRVPSEHVWSGHLGSAAGTRAGFGRVERAVVDAVTFAVFSDGAFVLPMRLLLGASPAVSLRDLIGLIARDPDVERNTDVIRETRDMIEHMLELHPDSETDTLMPLVPRVNLKRVLRVLAGIIPAEIERFRHSGDWRWLIQEMGSDIELAATLGQGWATADAAVEVSFVETEGSLDELLVGPEEDEGPPARWQYSISNKTLAGRKQYTGHGAGCAPRPAGHYGAMLRNESEYAYVPDRARQQSAKDWAYTAAQQTLSPRDKATNFGLVHVGKAEQMTVRGRRSTGEQVAATETGRLPLWKRPHPKGGRTARARLEGSTTRLTATEALDDSLAHTWQSSVRNESWRNKDTSLRTESTEVDETLARTMPDGCGTHPAPPETSKGGGRSVLIGQDAPEWTDTLRSSDVSNLRTSRFSEAATTDALAKHPDGWRYSNRGQWGEQGTQELDTTRPDASEPGHGGMPWGTPKTKDAGHKDTAPEGAWRYAMQAREIGADKLAAHPRGHTDREAATQGAGAVPLAAPSHAVKSRVEYAARYSMTHRPTPPADLLPEDDPEDLERVGQLWRLRAAVAPGRLWSPSKRDATLEHKPISVHEATPLGGGTSLSVQEFRRSLHEPVAGMTIKQTDTWQLSSTQRTLEGNSIVMPLADTGLSPRGGHGTAHENLAAYLATRSPPNTRPAGKSPLSALRLASPSSASNFSHSQKWFTEKLAVEAEPKTKFSLTQQLQAEQPTDDDRLGWSYSTHEEGELPAEEKLWGNTVKSVHEKPKVKMQGDIPSWSRGRGTNTTTLW